LTQTFPLDFAAAICGLEAVPPAGAAEADFFGVLAAGELAAGAIAEELAAGVEVGAGAGADVELADDFWLLVFAAGAAAGVPAAGALAAGEEAAGVAASALADFLLLFLAVVVSDAADASVEAPGAALESALAAFLLLLLFLALVVSGVAPAPVGAAGAALASALADFLLLFFAVALSEDPAALAEVELWSASVVEDFFLLDFDLLVLAELSAPPVSELAAVPAVVLFLDFVLEDFVSLAAAA